MNKSIDIFLTILEKQISNYAIQDKNIILFRQCAYALLLLKMLLIWPELSIFYRHGVKIGFASLMPHKLFFLPFFHSCYNIYWLVACIVVGISIFAKGNRLLSAAVVVISLNYLELTFRAYDTGDKLHNFLILMLLFIHERAKKDSLRQMVNNAAVLIIQLHFCLMYFVNAYGKVIHPFWRDGSLLDSVWHLSYYTNSDFVPYWFFNPTLQIITAWSVIVFEFMFPVLIWFKPYKKPLIYAGILFHISISILLSIPDFCITMIIVYLLFYDFKSSGEKNPKLITNSLQDNPSTF